MMADHRQIYHARLKSMFRQYFVTVSLLLIIDICHANGPQIIPNSTTKVNTNFLPLDNLKPLLSVLANAPKEQQQGAITSSNQQQSLAANNSRRLQIQAQTNSQQQLLLKETDDPIIKLDYTSINDEILRKRTASFVYFNANFNNCRHCYKFYSIWRELALDIRWWRQVVKLFMINCSDDDNIDVCRRAGVTQFPQVKFYWIMSQSLDQDGHRIRIIGKSVHAMRHQIMDKVLDSYNEHKSLIARAQQQRNPVMTINGGGGAALKPLQSLMPFFSQMLGATSSQQANGAGLAGLMGMFMGGGSSSPQQSPLASLIGGSGGGGPIMSFQGINDMFNAASSIASWRKSLTIQPIPNNWPDFEPIDVGGDTQRLLDWLPLDASKGIGALLVMETPEFLYLGLEVMLDLSPYSNSTYLARVRDERSILTRNLTKRDDVQAPALIYVSETREARLLMTTPKFTNDEDLRRAFVRTFERRQVKYPVKRVLPRLTNSQLSPSSESSDSIEDEEIMSRVNHIYTSDLINTIRASLMDQVFKHPDLSDDQYNALVKYVYTLINYFPFNNDDSRKFFTRLHAWLQNQVSPMDINEYKKQFHDIDEVLGKRREWIACKSLSNTKAIPTTSRKSGLLFENPSQLGKMVSNITKLIRTGQQKAGELKNLISMFTSGQFSPVMLSGSNSSSSGGSHRSSGRLDVASLTASGPMIRNSTTEIGQQQQRVSGGSAKSKNKDESPIERLFSGLTDGSLGSDSSILKLISTALTGGGTHNDTATGNSRSTKFAREYPCGAWKLAHVMVVNEYIKDSPRKDVKHIVIHSLYQYMLNFYACPTCGNRVSDVSGEFRLSLDDHLNDQGDSIMLLWEIHNRVNKRLESELRPGSPAKQQFPSESLCAKCRAPKAQNDIVSTPNWHEKQVLNFLVHHYRPQSIITSNSDGSSSSSDSSSRSAATTATLIRPASICNLHALMVNAACSLSSFLIQLKLHNFFSREWRDH